MGVKLAKKNKVPKCIYCGEIMYIARRDDKKYCSSCYRKMSYYLLKKHREIILKQHAEIQITKVGSPSPSDCFSKYSPPSV